MRKAYPKNRPLRCQMELLGVPSSPAQSQWASSDLYPLGEILEAIFYVVRSGCAWRVLPDEFPPWKTLYHYFRSWRLDGTSERMHAALGKSVCGCASTEIPKPSAGVVDRATRSRPQAWVGSSALRREPRRSKEASGIC